MICVLRSAEYLCKTKMQVEWSDQFCYSATAPASAADQWGDRGQRVPVHGNHPEWKALCLENSTWLIDDDL